MTVCVLLSYIVVIFSQKQDKLITLRPHFILRSYFSFLLLKIQRNFLSDMKIGDIAVALLEFYETCSPYCEKSSQILRSWRLCWGFLVSSHSRSFLYNPSAVPGSITEAHFILLQSGLCRGLSSSRQYKITSIKVDSHIHPCPDSVVSGT